MQTLSRHWALVALFLLQAGCAAFFVYDAIVDLLGLEAQSVVPDTDTFEYILAGVLVLSLGLTAWELRRLIRKQDRMDDQLRIASGAFAEVIEAQFDDWGLSESERAVAMMAIKGLSIAEMAEARQTREGTIKAQSAAVYRKAGVSGRLQLLSLFIEELVAAAPGRPDGQETR